MEAIKATTTIIKIKSKITNNNIILRTIMDLKIKNSRIIITTRSLRQIIIIINSSNNNSIHRIRTSRAAQEFLKVVSNHLLEVISKDKESHLVAVEEEMVIRANGVVQEVAGSLTLDR